MTVPANARTLRQLVVSAGLSERAQPNSQQAKRRYIWRHGRLRALPAHPLGLLTSDLLSWRGRLRLLREPFVRASKSGDADETLAEFFSRRLGPEVVPALADPFVTGVFAAHPSELAVDAFPKLLQMERAHGSLLRGALAARTVARHRKPGSEDTLGARALLSFPDGLGELPAALARQLGERIETGTELTAIAPAGTGWELTVDASGSLSKRAASALILAVPADRAAVLLESIDGEAARVLASIPHTPLCVVSLGYSRSDVPHALDGFGLLCASDSPLTRPTGEQLDGVLGILFSSSIFPNRAPDGQLSLNVMIGGTRDPAAVELEDAQLLERAHSACVALLGVAGEPRAVNIRRWPRAIPRYLPGHARRIAVVRESLAKRGIHLAGNYLAGVGLEAAATSGTDAAGALRYNRRPADG